MHYNKKRDKTRKYQGGEDSNYYWLLLLLLIPIAIILLIFINKDSTSDNSLPKPIVQKTDANIKAAQKLRGITIL